MPLEREYGTLRTGGTLRTTMCEENESFLGSVETIGIDSQHFATPIRDGSGDVGYVFSRAECEHTDIACINILSVSCCTHTFK